VHVNMQLIDLEIASDFKGCRLGIKTIIACMLDICRYS